MGLPTPTGLNQVFWHNQTKWEEETNKEKSNVNFDEWHAWWWHNEYGIVVYTSYQWSVDCEVGSL